MAEAFNQNSYDDIIDLPYPFPTKQPRMSMYDRAAQFGSFAALTGHEEAIEETARFTLTWVEPDETVKEELNHTLQLLYQALQENRQQGLLISVTYFEPDELKAGGEYKVCRNLIKKIDSLQRYMVMRDETTIPLDYIVEIEIINMKM